MPIFVMNIFKHIYTCSSAYRIFMVFVNLLICLHFSFFFLIAPHQQVCALSKRGMMLQPDILAYNEAIMPPPGAVGAAAASGVANNAYGVHHYQHQSHQPSGGGAESAMALASTSAISAKSIQQNVIITNAGLSYEDVLNDDFQFDMDGHDVMVFLHIQKTGGTSFGRHLVRDLDLKVCQMSRYNAQLQAHVDINIFKEMYVYMYMYT